jgi:DnaJ-class molecular chaperone
MTKRDYYEVLGVPRDANPDDLKSSFRNLARQFHPDVNKSHDAEEKFKEINEAYGVLSEPDAGLQQHGPIRYS